MPKAADNVGEAQFILATALRANGAATLAVFLDKLVDLAVRGGQPVVSPLDTYKKLCFYRGLIIELAARGIIE